jgi:prepilin-type N-terminal cleavage/methylation domain-containing protein
MRKGFTLIELMIVIAIIAIIAAIAIPNLLSARKSANESRAIGNMRTIYTQQTQENLAKAPNLYPLGANVGYNGSTTVGSYVYCTKSFSGGVVWSVTASPKQGGGTKYFYIDATGIMRFNTSVKATLSDKQID